MWNSGYPSLETFQEDIDNERLFVLVDGIRIIASTSVDHNVADAFYPESKNRSKSFALLDEIGNVGRPVTILRRFFVHPAYQRKGYGKMLFRDLESRYKANDFMVAVYEKNTNAIPFYEKLGFYNFGLKQMEYGEFSSQFLLAKLYSEPGLCRNITW